MTLPHNEDRTVLEQQLNSFSLQERRLALEKLAQEARSGRMPIAPPKEEVNLHFHTSFSFNANNWSPSRIAWESLKYGLEVAGIVDFDILDGMEEFLSAGDLLGLKTVVGMETRVFVKELEDKVMSSPNEPGIAYFMASGCFKRPPSGSRAGEILNGMARTARGRNISLMDRVNAYLDEVQLDYESDVVPLTPSGNATERHLLLAYDMKARSVFGGNEEKIAGFWAAKLEMDRAEAAAVIADAPKFHEKMRSKLMKFGGVGYVPPDRGSFPSVEDAIEMIRGMDALPMITWLDGTNPGEEDAPAFLELFQSKGVAAMNIIPDRNWNLADSEEKALKVRKLGEIVQAARKLNLPICVGTEMNKAGLPFVDDFSALEMRPFVHDFINGARCLYGHTLLSRFADFGYLSERAVEVFGDNAAAKNEFYARVGGGPIPYLDVCRRLGSANSPDEILGLLKG